MSSSAANGSDCRFDARREIAAIVAAASPAPTLDPEKPKRKSKASAVEEDVGGGPPGVGGGSGTGEDEERPPEFSDEALALRFAAEQTEHLRFVSVWSKWLVYDGRRWSGDIRLSAIDRVRRLCRRVASECDVKRVATAIASAKTVAAVERLARADQRLAATVEQFDANPDILGAPQTIDLKIGECYLPRREDFITKSAAVVPRGSCPRWLAFLERVTGGDRALQDYLQRVAGYCLTGSVSEHALFFLYGTGGNGKGVFVSTLTGIMGDYARTAPIEIFHDTKHDRHPTELAMLRGARLVVANETEEGARFAEARIKMLTGGDRIAARFMRGDFFEFAPSFKVMIVGNHKPSLRSVDEALRRRLHLIPFMVTIPHDEKDPGLADKLKAEWPGILQWAIDGCIAWREQGLAPPEAVTGATTAYLQSEDVLGEWLAEAGCKGAWSEIGLLFENWRAWCERSGEYVGTKRKLSERLEARGFVAKKQRGKRGFFGLRPAPLN